MLYLKQSTSVDVPVGPFLDETDGKTAETALTITQPDVRLKKNGGAWAQKAAAQTLSHEEAGWYEVTLDATDTNTLGHLVVAIHESGALPVWREFLVLPATVYDALVAGTDNLDVNAIEISGDSTAADNLEADFDGTGYSGRYLRRSTAQAGAAGTITLDASASATDDLYNGNIVAIVSGTGAGQTRYISDYVGSTKVATVSESWITNPDNTSVFVVVPNARQVTAKKGVAFSNFPILMIDSTDDISGLASATVAVQISKDGGAFATCTNSPATGISNGLYKITLTATEMSADVIIIRATATGANAALDRIITVP